MMYKLCMIVLCVINGFITSAQNNPIFKGGNGDGENKISFAQAGNAVFTGGSGDGWTTASFTQAANNIFKGALGDGWGSASFLQASNNIFKGGAGDGWSSTTFLQAGNGIFKGGAGDGWNRTSFLQAGNSIFKGGIGDGWSSTYRPVGPLPVTLAYFDASKLGANAAKLVWKTAQEINTAYFEIERSTDAVSFNNIGKTTAAGNSSIAIEYSFTDQHPAIGLNYYRLKQVDKDARFIYTPARLVRFDGLNTGSIKYYPNPTQGVLNIELPESIRREQKIINITNAAGIVVYQVKAGSLANNIIQINFSRYPKGFYFIQVTTATTNSVQRIALQ